MSIAVGRVHLGPFSEDVGGIFSTGPASLWSMREVRMLGGTRDIFRCAGFPVPVRRSGSSSPWFPHQFRGPTCCLLHRVAALQPHSTLLVHDGPLPSQCSCTKAIESSTTHLQVSVSMSAKSYLQNLGQQTPFRGWVICSACCWFHSGRAFQTFYPSRRSPVLSFLVFCLIRLVACTLERSHPVGFRAERIRRFSGS